MPLLIFPSRNANEARLLAIRMAGAVRWEGFRLDRRGPGTWAVRPDDRG